MPSSSVAVGQPIVLSVALKNASTAPLTLPRATEDHQAEANYAISITDLQGHAVRRLTLQKDGEQVPHFVKSAPYELAPGQTLTEDCDLTQFWDLHLSGVYSAKVSRHIPLKDNTAVVSNAVQFTVVTQ